MEPWQVAAGAGILGAVIGSASTLVAGRLAHARQQKSQRDELAREKLEEAYQSLFMAGSAYVLA